MNSDEIVATLLQVDTLSISMHLLESFEQKEAKNAFTSETPEQVNGEEIEEVFTAGARKVFDCFSNCLVARSHKRPQRIEEEKKEKEREQMVDTGTSSILSPQTMADTNSEGFTPCLIVITFLTHGKVLVVAIRAMLLAWFGYSMVTDRDLLPSLIPDSSCFVPLRILNQTITSLTS
eukprot:753747-Hanusia_phi.AAC.3